MSHPFACLVSKDHGTSFAERYFANTTQHKGWVSHHHVLDNGGVRSPLCSLPAVQCKRLLVKPGSHKQVKMMSWKNNAGIYGSFDSFSTQFTLSKFLLSMSTRI